MKTFLHLTIFCCTVFLILPGCSDNENKKPVHFSSDLYINSVRKLNDVIVENTFPPMVATRNYTYANIAAYETISAVTDSLPSLAGKVRDLKKVPKPENPAMVNAEFAALIAFSRVGNAVTFPEGSMGSYIDTLEMNAKKAGMSSAKIKASREYGEKVSQFIMDWAKGDNYGKTRSASKFTIMNDESIWSPTPPAYAPATEPHWMEIRTLLMDSASEFLCPKPPPYDVKNKNSQFFKEVMTVKNAVDSLTDEQKHIAKFWDDNPFELHVTGHVMYATKKFSPAGHWMNIIGIAAEKKNLNFYQTVQAYTYSSLALFDAFISCWDEKYRHRYVRPETVINKYIDADWRPFIQTPPFPEYTSGHAVISAAVTSVLTKFFGDNFAFTDTTQEIFGIKPRSFSSFNQASEEAGMSRIYGGIHYVNTYNISAMQGKKVGELVIEKLNIQPLAEEKKYAQQLR